MALQLRRGTNAERLAITPANGELIFVTNYVAATVGPLWVGDGTTVGGVATDNNTTYTISAETVSGGANLRLTGSDASTDNVKFAGGTNTTVTRTDANTITISSAGDVVGPASATDNAIARFDLTTGKLIQNSGVIIDDSNNITGVASLTASGTVTATSGFVTGTLATRVVATQTTTSTAQFTLVSSTRNVMKCLINIVLAGNVHCCEAIVLRTSASTATIAVYGEMFNTVKLADFDADVSGGTLRLLVTPANISSMVFTVLSDSLS